MPEGTLLPVVFLAFGTIVIVGEIVIPARQKQGFGPQSIRIIGITIAAALSASTLIPLERLTAVIGLLGTLAGYLAGRSENKAE
ncbi:MAG TPA: hypothetical protein VGN95_23100 [Pyrinomonadaceae bacterium]|jgi:hypothetical protein|nr:hypothetical protein [Pyrinomonadaceae bacterium]